MTKHRDLDYGERLPESWLDAIQEAIGSYVSPNFLPYINASYQVQVDAGNDNDQVGVMINGRWRWRTTPITAAHPGGSAGTYDVYVTASDNSFTGGQPETDNTDYSFGLVVRAQGSPPATALYRKVATLTWDGSFPTGIMPLLSVPQKSGDRAGYPNIGTEFPETGLYDGYRFTLLAVRTAPPYLIAQDFVKYGQDSGHPNWAFLGGGAWKTGAENAHVQDYTSLGGSWYRAQDYGGWPHLYVAPLTGLYEVEAEVSAYMEDMSDMSLLQFTLMGSTSGYLSNWGGPSGGVASGDPHAAFPLVGHYSAYVELQAGHNYGLAFHSSQNPLLSGWSLTIRPVFGYAV